MRNALSNNPPRTLAALVALALPPLTILVTRLVDRYLANDPELHAATLAFALAVVVYLVSLVGRYVQRFTEPRHVVDELLEIRATEATVDDDEPKTSDDLPAVP